MLVVHYASFFTLDVHVCTHIIDTYIHTTRTRSRQHTVKYHANALPGLVSTYAGNTNISLTKPNVFLILIPHGCTTSKLQFDLVRAPWTMSSQLHLALSHAMIISQSTSSQAPSQAPSHLVTASFVKSARKTSKHFRTCSSYSVNNSHS